MTALVSLLFIAMIPIDCKIINFFLTLVYIQISPVYTVKYAPVMIMNKVICGPALIAE